MKTIQETSLLSIRIGDILQYEDGRIGQLVDLDIVPNGTDDTSIVLLLKLKLDTGYIWAASNRFKPVDNILYLERIYKV